MITGEHEAALRAAAQPRADHLIHTIPLISERAVWWLLACSVALGATVRGVHIVLSDFPLNDGGMFYAMARDIEAHGFQLPAFTTYNYARIPFAYSPLGFYIAALLDRLTPIHMLEAFRLLPFLYSVATLIAFALLAKRMLQTQAAAIGATLAFALIPRSFVWLLMGGGVARGLGLTCALFALHEAYRLYAEGRPRFIVTTGLAFACTVLAHVETGWFLGFSIVIFWVAFGRTRRTFAASIAVAAIGAAVTAPWWVTVALRHGIAPFIEANASGGNILSGGAIARETFLSLARITSTSEPLFPLIGALGLLGALTALRARHLVLPVWWVAIIVLDLRAYPTFTSIPVALLAGLGISQIVLPLAHLVWDRPLLSRPAEDRTPPPWRRVSRGAVLLALALLAYSTFGALFRASGFAGEANYLVGLTRDERAAMGWIRVNTPADARVLIVPRGPWQVDKESEWFPVLAQRTSVATVQGTEWTRSFDAHIKAFNAAWDCGYRLADCLATWATDTGSSYTHVFVPRTEHGQCCATLVDSLRRTPAYRVVYDGPGGTVFAYGQPPGTALAARVATED